MEVRQEAGAAAVLDPEIKMEEEEEEEEEEGAVDPEEGEPKEGTALPRTAAYQAKEEPEDETPGNWVARLQEFLKTLEAPLPSAGKTSQQPERKPCRGPKRSPVPSQGTRGADKEPKGLWVSPKELTFPGDAGQEPSARLDAASLGKERARGLPASPAKAKMQRQRFRMFRYEDARGPREVCQQLWERCREWLEPEKHSKEQMLELVTLEQFLAVLPPELQGWVEGRGPGSCAQAVTLAEEFLWRQPEAKVRELQVTGLNEEHGAVSPAAREALPSQEKPRLPTEKEDGRKGNGSMPEDRRLREKKERRPLVGIPEQKEQPTAWMKTGHEGDFWSQGEAEENQRKAEGSKGEVGVTGLDRPGQPQGEGVTRPATQEEEEEEEEENWVKDDPSGEDPPLMVPEDPEGEEKPFRCWHCGKSFSSSVKLVTHERTHVGEKLYTCSSCGESERTHTVQKPHKCSRCGNTFGWSPQERLPGREKPYTCSECGKSCSQRSDFLKHQRTHTGEHKREQQDHKAERPGEMKREPEEEAPPSEEPRKKQKLTMETRSVGSAGPEPELRPPEPDRTPSLRPLSSAGMDLPLTSKEQEEYAAALIYVMGTDFINRHGEAGRFVYSLCKRRVGGSQTWVPGWIHYRCKKLILFHCAESTKKPKSKLKCFHLGNITRRLAIHQRECAPMELCPCLTNLQEIHLRRMVHDWAHQYEHESQPGSLDSPPRTSQQAQELEPQGHQEEE